MRGLICAVMIVAAGSCAMSSVAAELCVAPVEPKALPDAANASEQEMVEAQREVKHYLGAMEEHLKCLQARGTKTDMNVAVDKMQAIAARFNTAVRTFRAKKA